MREILFRGIKTETKGEWIEGYFKIMHGKCYIANYDYSPFEVEVYEHTISQFTGLADKNGNKIFEGDYIYVPYNYIGKQEVKYLNDKGRYNISNYALDKVEIIGNIHE